MAQDNIIRLRCSVCKKPNYWTHKNRKSVERKIELKKFCKQCVTHTKHTELKKK